MREGYRKHPVQPPAIPTPEEFGDTRSIVARLFAIEPVAVDVVFDYDPPHDLVRLENPNSAALIELLCRANLERGTVSALACSGVAVAPGALARLNWFLHIHGFTRGFRGWKIARQRAGGVTLWRSGAAWLELKEVLRL